MWPTFEVASCSGLYGALVITGYHSIVFSEDAVATRAFLRDVLGWPSLDAGAAG